MKKILLGALLASTAMSAQAADLAVKAPYYKAPVAPVYDWTGFYLGVNAGLGLGRNQNRIFGNGGGFSQYLAPFGALGGGQIGYNWQTNSFLGPLVFGVEADIQGADMSDNRSNFPVPYNQTLDWFGTARGRVGLVTGPTLTYLTGGYAYGHVNTTLTGVGAPPFSGNRDGWTWGSGVEAALGGNWTGKIEYLYLDLGDRTDLIANTVPMRNTFHENIFRVGLNYRIGGNGAYTPMATANWTGFYLGGNVGSGTSRDRTTLEDVTTGTRALFNLAPDGIIGGGQIGYNWQAGNIVYGLETDFQGSTQEDNKTCFGCAPSASLDFNAKLQWFGTVRGRLGYAIGPSLFYATGGFAYGNVKTAINEVSFSDTRTGWTVGAGIETPFDLFGLFGPNWTSTTEYLYVDLGKAAHDFTLAGAPGQPGVLTTGAQEHIFRTGLNYHFNTPVVTKY
ncbi:outer membrane protein [Nitrobacter sp.]|uniref:outer membrane protein n=1 Tax=Nitrobacter sp. TaxID=29420 RepID=UPI00399D6292